MFERSPERLPLRSTESAVRFAAIYGCLLGTAIGDSVGLPYEGLTASRAKKLYPGELRQRLLFGKGMYSDDTEHACMTAEAYLLAPCTPERFSRALSWKLRLWLLGIPAGIGQATLRSCLKLWLGFPASKSGVNSAGNGPAMRAPILGVLLGDNSNLLKSYVSAATVITHTDQRALDGALLLALAAHCSLRSQGRISPNVFVTTVQDWVTSGRLSSAAEEIAMIAALNQHKEPLEFRTQVLGLEDAVSGYINHTVPMALHIWLKYPNDYQKAVTAAVECGGDTDTLAAIAGGIVGAATGAGAIPENWILNLWEFPRNTRWMESLARKLADEGYTCEQRLEINPAALLTRNLLFLLVVLFHGFRRLGPPY